VYLDIKKEIEKNENDEKIQKFSFDDIINNFDNQNENKDDSICLDDYEIIDENIF
jgi:hypothetical protein